MLPARKIIVGSEPPALPRVRLVGHGRAALVVGLVAGCLFGAAAPALAEWLVQSSGEAGVQLASLEPLKVGEGRLEQSVFPGQTAGLVADVENGNPVALEILSSSLKDGLHSEVAACQEALDTIKYLDSNGVRVETGKNEKLVLGRFQLPGKLPNACQGEKLKAEVLVKASYGS